MNSFGDTRADVLTPFEIESYISCLSPTEISSLGSLSFLDSHHRIKQLTVQSIIQALSSREETVKEFLLTFEKLPHLVHDLLLVELWRECIFPKLPLEKIHTFLIYPILYHESTIINLLETVLYHPQAAEGLGDSSLDLVDYCLRSLTYLVTLQDQDFNEESDAADANAKNSILTQRDTLLLGSSLKCLSTLRYLIENIDSLGQGLISRLCSSSDTPLLLVELIVRKPWRKEYWQQQKVMDFDPSSSTFKEIDPALRNLISKTEAQAWLSIYLLLKNNQILQTYELYSSRRNQLLKLRPYLNSTTLDQLPILGEFQMFLDQIAMTSMTSGSAQKSPLLLEIIPEIRKKLEEEFDQNFKQILALCRKELGKNVEEKAKRLAESYDFSCFEGALPEKRGCGNCGKEAERKCGRCRKVWYCSRECQVSQWPMHRDNCDQD